MLTSADMEARFPNRRCPVAREPRPWRAIGRVPQAADAIGVAASHSVPLRIWVVSLTLAMVSIPSSMAGRVLVDPSDGQLQRGS
jgi:hypothetical protein